MNNYLGSSYHIENARKAALKAKEAMKKQSVQKIKDYNKNPNFCLYCKKPLIYNIDEKTIPRTLRQIKKDKKFCNNSCAASYNNKGRKLSQESKDRIGNSVVKRLKETSPETYYRKCIICGNKFEKIRNKSGLSVSTTCSKECHRIQFSRNSIQTMEKVVKEGRHKGWAFRIKLKPSYPEQYFIDLFNNENIKGWERELKVGRYFIDFAFKEQKIALEIDGSQHWKLQERIESDIKKDLYLKKNDWNIIRIKWFNPINEKNKEKLYKQIKEFKDIIL